MPYFPRGPGPHLAWQPILFWGPRRSARHSYTTNTIGRKRPWVPPRARPDRARFVYPSAVPVWRSGSKYLPAKYVGTVMAPQGSKPGQKCQTSSKRKMGQINEESESETAREDDHASSSQAQGEPSEPRSTQAPDTKRTRTHERRDYSERATAPPPDPVLRGQGSFPSRSVFSD